MQEEKRYNPFSRKDEEIRNEKFTGERALYRGRNLKVYDSVFFDGESPLKESRDIELFGCEFQWKYPIWYSKNIHLQNSCFQEMARSGVWYTEDMVIEDCIIGAPKNFRRCKNITIKRTSLPIAQETLWMCDGVELSEVSVKGDYFGMNSENIKVDRMNLFGNYAFDGAKNLEIRNSRLMTKDCFWNCENVTVYDSHILGEYLGWNTKNLTFVNCTIESNQGLCYIENLKMENCRLINTSLAFEYAENIDADITSDIDSVLNPGSGEIRVKEIKELIIEPDNCDIKRTNIIC